MKRKSRSSNGLFMIGIAALFLTGFMMLIIFGAQSYRQTIEGQNRNMNSRASLSYISACVKAYDTEDAISVRDTKYGNTLVLSEPGTDYGLFIFLDNGQLMEQYARQDTEPSADHAETICSLRSFSLEEKENGLINVSTDDGSILLHQRSVKGGKS